MQESVGIAAQGNVYLPSTMFSSTSASSINTAATTPPMDSTPTSLGHSTSSYASSRVSQMCIKVYT